MAGNPKAVLENVTDTRPADGRYTEIAVATRPVETTWPVAMGGVFAGTLYDRLWNLPNSRQHQAQTSSNQNLDG